MKSYAYIEQLTTARTPGTQRIEITGVMRRIAAQLAIYHMRARTRRELAWLNATQLRDLGIDPVDAASEAAKPFWRP